MLRQLVTDPPSSWEKTQLVLDRDKTTQTAVLEPQQPSRKASVWKTITLSKGLDLPISGGPAQTICKGNAVTQVALIPSDYNFLKPRLAVQVGDQVQTGQTLMVDRKRPEIRFTSPGTGRIAAIHRGAKRVLQAIVVELEGDEEVEFSHFLAEDLDRIDADAVRQTLLESGLWTALRQRPLGMIPAPDAQLSSIFVTAIDTHPLAADPSVVIGERADDFRNGLRVLTKLGQKGLFLCKAPGKSLPGMELDGVKTVEFSGPHPAGLPGTHIHFLDPAGRDKAVGYVNYQDVIEIGHLFTTGRLDPSRVIALAGPSVHEPRLVRTRIGANVDELIRDELGRRSNPRGFRFGTRRPARGRPLQLSRALPPSGLGPSGRRRARVLRLGCTGVPEVLHQERVCGESMEELSASLLRLASRRTSGPPADRQF